MKDVGMKDEGEVKQSWSLQFFGIVAVVAIVTSAVGCLTKLVFEPEPRRTIVVRVDVIEGWDEGSQWFKDYPYPPKEPTFAQKGTPDKYRVHVTLENAGSFGAESVRLEVSPDTFSSFAGPPRLSRSSSQAVSPIALQDVVNDNSVSSSGTKWNGDSRMLSQLQSGDVAVVEYYAWHLRGAGALAFSTYVTCRGWDSVYGGSLTAFAYRHMMLMITIGAIAMAILGAAVLQKLYVTWASKKTAT